MHRVSYACCGFFQRGASEKRHLRTTSRRNAALTPSVVDELSAGSWFQPVPESTLEYETRYLQQKIKRFVDNCLGADSRPNEYVLNNDMLVEYSCFNADWIFLLTNKHTRYAALRMFIARVLVARIDVRPEVPSLIPHPALRDTYQLISQHESRGRGYSLTPPPRFPAWKAAGTEDDSLLPGGNDDLRRTWRALSAYLIGDPNSTLSSSPASSLASSPDIRYDEREAVVEKTVDDISDCLSPFLLNYPYTRKLLADAVHAASNLGWILFSQIHATEFHWSTDGMPTADCQKVGRKGTMEVFPELRRRVIKKEKETWVTLYRRTMG